MCFVSCPKQGLEMEAVVLYRVGFLEYFCPKQGQDFKPLAAPLYPNIGRVPPGVRPPPPRFDYESFVNRTFECVRWAKFYFEFDYVRLSSAIERVVFDWVRVPNWSVRWLDTPGNWRRTSPDSRPVCIKHE